MKKPLVISISITIIIPLIVYCIYFGRWEISPVFRDWIEFSQFFILFITLFNGFILAYLTWQIHSENISMNRPIIIFTIQKPYPVHSIKNIGNGPAINIEIYLSKKDDLWQLKLFGLTLGKGEQLWLGIDGQNRLAATYFDQSGHKQRPVYMKNSVMQFQNIENELKQLVLNTEPIWFIETSTTGKLDETGLL